MALANFYNDIRRIIQLRLSAKYSDTRIQFSNVPLKPTPLANESWISINILYGSESNRAFVGREVVSRQNGLCQIDIFVPQATGTAYLSTLATKLKKIFSNYEEGDFHVTKVEYREIGFSTDSVWYRGVITIYYVADVKQGVY